MASAAFCDSRWGWLLFGWRRGFTKQICKGCPCGCISSLPLWRLSHLREQVNLTELGDDHDDLDGDNDGGGGGGIWSDDDF